MSERLPAMDMGWIRNVDRELVDESEAILREVIGQIDRMQVPIRISAYSHDSPPSLPIETEDYWLERRREVVEMLRLRGIISRWQGPLFGTEVGDVFVIDADEATVRAALKAIEGRNKPPAPYDISWVATYSPGVLEGCQIVLEEIHDSIDLGRNPIRIRRHGPTQFDHRPPPDDARRMIERREEILGVLQMKGVIRSWGPLTGEYGSVEGFIVDADRDPVVRALDAIEDRLTGRSARQPAPPPTSTPALAPPGPGSTSHVYYGPVTNVNTAGDNATVSVTVSASLLQAVSNLIGRVEAEAGKLDLKPADAELLRRELTALDVETKTAKPDKGRLRRGIEAVGKALGRAGASAVAAELVRLAEEVLKQLM